MKKHRNFVRVENNNFRKNRAEEIVYNEIIYK